MKKAGRALWPLVVVVLVLALGGVFFVISGASASSTADNFMEALARGNAKKLAELGYLEGMTPDQAEKAWTKTVDHGMYYRFFWHVKTSSQPTPDTATVTMDVARNADTQSSYGEDYSLNLIKMDGKWKVDVRQIPRDLYPGLPR